MSGPAGGVGFGRAVRERFLLDPEVAFLNHGSFGAAPRSVLAAQTAWRERLERDPVHFMADELPGLLRQTADRLGAYLGARGQDLALVDNATTGINTVLANVPLEPGDEIVALDHGYQAVLNTLDHHAARTGARVVRARVPYPLESADQVVAAVESALSPRTRLAVLDHITSATALVLPIDRLVTLCRDRGVPVAVDGAHAPGMIPLELDRLGADWYTGNCHKWLCAPKGCAFLHVRADRQAGMEPLVISHGWRKGFTDAFDWVGTRDPSPWLSLDAALQLREELGDRAIREHNHSLALAAAHMISASWGEPIPAPDELFGSMVPIRLPGGHPEDFALARELHDALWRQHRVEAFVLPFAGTLWVRISAQIYNEPDDYRRLAEALDERGRVRSG